jgi:hypothetical protein
LSLAHRVNVTESCTSYSKAWNTIWVQSWSNLAFPPPPPHLLVSICELEILRDRRGYKGIKY